MTAHRDRVDQLIALALDQSTTVDERRNAALQAVKLIDKHAMLDDQTEIAEHKKEIETLQKQVREMRRALGTIGQVARTFIRTWSPIVSDVEPEEMIDEPSPVGTRQNKAWSVGAARVAGRNCPRCGLPILLGDLIATERSVGDRGVGDTLHHRCFQKREREKR